MCGRNHSHSCCCDHSNYHGHKKAKTHENYKGHHHEFRPNHYHQESECCKEDSHHTEHYSHHPGKAPYLQKELKELKSQLATLIDEISSLKSKM